MCGIAGIIDFNSRIEETILKRMVNTLSHRGPDNRGSLILRGRSANIGFAHARLSIIDLSQIGNQPMQYKGFTIVFNGEIYNYLEIKIELEALGHKFESHSDTEVILHSFEVWGVKCLSKFIGMFAFALYDSVNAKVIFARDRTGVKPFYYYVDSNFVIFGSELKALMANPSFPKKIDSNSVGDYFKRGWIGAPYTIFESTFKVKPGHYIQINTEDKQIDEDCYWDINDYYGSEELDISFSEAKRHLRGLLKSACDYRMVADTEVGIFISGGFDSSTTAAILQADRTNKLNTFSIGFEDDQFNEAPYAREIARYLGTNHHEMICTSREALEIVDLLPLHYDEPFADSSAIPTMLVSKMASETVKVAISADGGDEVFGGYPKYYDNLDVFQKVNRIPKILGPTVQPILSTLSYFIADPHKQIHLEKLHKILGCSNSNAMFRYRTEPKHFSDKEVKQLLKDRHLNLDRKTSYDEVLLRDKLDPAKYMMALDYKTNLVEDMLVKVDRATMAFSLEGREPFLDHRLVEFASKLNSGFHFRDGITKSLLREISYEHIPKVLLDRPKKGFSIPINSWLLGDLKGLVLHYSTREFLKAQGIFNVKSCEEIINNFYTGKDKNGARVWIFLMFQMWFQKWMLS